MTKNKHLTFDERNEIEIMLKRHCSFRQIASSLSKDPTTISKEIRSHSLSRRIGGVGVNYNACAFRFKCSKRHICTICHSERKYTLCRRCSMCNAFCESFEKETCNKLDKPPYVCNGCSSRLSCTLEKKLYYASEAHQQYRNVLSESRTGISLSEQEIRRLDELITPLIRKQQSPHHICVTNRDSITVSERTIYRLIDSRIISAMNIDLPRKVRFRPRKKTVQAKVDKACRIGRTYDCFLSYMDEHPNTPIVQLDTVEGTKGGKVLLTIHFVKAEMMLAFIRDYNDSQSVIDIFNDLFITLGSDNFCRLFKVCLADNGSEFSNPTALEFDDKGNRRTRIFYCNPSSPFQKGSAERNHEFIRYFFPKGKSSFDSYSQFEISLMMDHINSYCRESLGDQSPYDMFSFLYGHEILDLLGCNKIAPNDVTLNKSIIKEAHYDLR